MCHANGFHGLVWRPVAERLRQRFRCVALDFRGHGASVRTAHGDLHWDEYRQDILTTLDAIPARGAYAIGHSMGGTAALAAAAAEPGLLRALFCYEPILPRLTSQAAVQDGTEVASRTLRRVSRFTSRAAASDYLSGRPAFRAVHPEALRAYLEHGLSDQPDGSVILRCSPATEAAGYTAAWTCDAHRQIPDVSCPVTVARGCLSLVMDAASIRRIADLLPNGKVTELPGIGHLGPLENPDVVAAAVLAAFSPQL